MILNSITIENFKCFQNSTKIDFGKLTLLTGPNSSGKSSIIYSILGAIQSGEFPFQFSTNGKYVNMGDFKEIVFNHNRKEKIKIRLDFKSGSFKKIETIWVEDNNNNLPKLAELKIEAEYFEINIKEKSGKYSANFIYDPELDPLNKVISPAFYQKFNDLISESIKFAESQNNKKHSKTTNNAKIIFDEITSKLNIKDLTLEEIPFFNAGRKRKGIFKLKQIFDLILRAFREYDEQINFISSFRLHPERTYLEQTKSRLKVNNFGDGYLDQIIVWETKDKNKFSELLVLLKNLNLINSIKSKRLEGGRYEIAVKIKENAIDTSLSDVGFGISQFLPIIVADLQLPESSTLFVAQPEIHLHPSVQSLFGDYLVNQIQNKSKNYIIETHSEYLINKIRLAVVKEEIKEKDIAVWFIDNEGDAHTVHQIKFNKKGQIIGAPENFFKTYMMDVMNIAISAAEE